MRSDQDGVTHLDGMVAAAAEHGVLHHHDVLTDPDRPEVAVQHDARQDA